MAGFTHSFTTSIRDSSGQSLVWSETVNDDTELNFSGTISHSGSNVEVDWTCTVANLKSIYIRSSVPLTIKTNNSGSPQETITLVAGGALKWTLTGDGSGHVPFAGDVTKLYCTVTSGTDDADLEIRAIAHQHA